jgi:hypothetical protein
VEAVTFVLDVVDGVPLNPVLTRVQPSHFKLLPRAERRASKGKRRLERLEKMLSKQIESR